MRLVSIFNVWDDWNWLDISVEKIRPLVDEVIIIASEKSNWGEISPIPKHWLDVGMANNGVSIFIREPFFNHPINCETDKRNYGLETAKLRGCTHFLSIDADEIYAPEEFLKAKQRFLNEPDLNGLVCRIKVYFGSPTLTIGMDATLVPFIHKITPGIKHEFNRKYPYAWDNGRIQIDPTRSLNINSGVKMDDAVMHHYSHVRKDYEKKIRNSTARNNIQKSSLREDYANAKPGYFCKFYNTILKECEDKFNLSDAFASIKA